MERLGYPVNMAEGSIENKVIGWFKGLLGTKDQALPAEQYLGYAAGKNVNRAAKTAARVIASTTIAAGPSLPVAAQGATETGKTVTTQVTDTMERVGYTVPSKINFPEIGGQQMSSAYERANKSSIKRGSEVHGIVSGPQHGNATPEIIDTKVKVVSPQPAKSEPILSSTPTPSATSTPEPSPTTPYWQRPAGTMYPTTKPTSDILSPDKLRRT